MPVSKSKGFTLIELVIGIIVFAIALSLFLSLMVPQVIRSVDPIYQVRAAELGQALINEIASKPFDENSSRVGGFTRCNDNGALPCTAIVPSNNDNVEEGVANRDLFDDVDDYNGLIVSGSGIRNSLNQSIQVGSPAYDIYQGFNVAVSVFYDDDLNGLSDQVGVIGNTKLITVTVTTPNQENIVFSTYRTNY